jgi:hypothetical protein
MRIAGPSGAPPIVNFKGWGFRFSGYEKPSPLHNPQRWGTQETAVHHISRAKRKSAFVV